MKIPWRAANEGPPVPEEQYQERFWRHRLNGIGLDTATKEFLAIEFKRTQDARSNYVERATAVAQNEYKSLLAGLQTVGQVKGWKVHHIVFVGGTYGSIRVESFNRNMKAFGVLENKWDPIRKKLVSAYLRNRTRCCGPTSHKREGHGARGGTGAIARAGNISNGTCMRETARTDRGQVTNS
jgi:hypothetical protein